VRHVNEVSAADIGKTEKWPRTAQGTIDWVVVFNDEDEGIIPLVASAQSVDTLVDCTAMVIQMLFSRDSDGALRAGFTTALAQVVAECDGDRDAVCKAVSNILTDIRDDRTEKAADYARHKEHRRAAQKLWAGDENELAPDDETEPGDPRPPDDPARVFEEGFCDSYDQRFQILWSGIEQQPKGDLVLPFLLSADFAIRFEGILRQHFLPTMTSRCLYLVTEIERHKPEHRQEFIRQHLADKRIREQVWPIWKDVWAQMTEKQKLPKKPKQETGMFGNLVKAVKAAATEEGDLELAEWEDEVEMIKTRNAMTADVNASLVEVGVGYEAPLKGDDKYLVSLLGRTPNGLRDQIAALRQIAEQSSHPGQAFDKYAKGRDLEFALLSVSYKHQDMFLEQKILHNMLRGLKKHEKEMQYPLLVRYLPDYV